MTSQDEANESEVSGMPGAGNNDVGCPTIPEQDSYNPADSVDKLEEAAKAMGFDQQCVSEAKAISDDTMSNSKAQANISTPFGGGSASYEENKTESYVDNTLTEKGCAPLSLVSNQLKLEEVAMTCNMNKTVSNQGAESYTNLSLRIETNPIIEQTVLDSIAAGRAEIQDLLDASQEAIALLAGDKSSLDAINKLVMNCAGVCEQGLIDMASGAIEKMFKDKTDLVENTHKMNLKTMEEYNYNNPVTANLEGVTIDQTIDSEITISSTQSIDDTSKSVMKESMQRLSRAVAHEELNSKVGPGATLDKAREMVNDQVEQSFTKNDTNINNSITENKMTMDTNNNVTLSVVGPIRNSDISQAIKSQVSLTVQQQVKKSVEIGKTVATKIINEEISKKIDNRIADGVDKVIAATGKSRAKLQEAIKAEDVAAMIGAQGESAGAMWTGAGQGLGDAAQGVGGGIGEAGRGLGEGAASALSALMIPIAVIGGIIVLVILYMMFGGSKAPAAAPAAGGNLAGLMAAAKSAGGANFAKLAAAAKGAAAGAKGGLSKFGLPIGLLFRLPWGKIIGTILFVVFVLFMIFYGYPKLKKKFEGRVRNNKVNIPAPRQRMQPVNTQSLKTPYMRGEPRFKGDRSARKIPSYKKINQSRNFRKPTQKQHVNMYNAVEPGINITTTHNPTYHFINKPEEDKPVAYTKKSRI